MGLAFLVQVLLPDRMCPIGWTENCPTLDTKLQSRSYLICNIYSVMNGYTCQLIFLIFRKNGPKLQATFSLYTSESQRREDVSAGIRKAAKRQIWPKNMVKRPKSQEDGPEESGFDRSRGLKEPDGGFN